VCFQKSDNSKGRFHEEGKQVFFFYNFPPKYKIKILLGDLMQKGEERILSKQQLRMRVYIRIVMIIILE
jgi:hypothetical protein